MMKKKYINEKNAQALMIRDEISRLKNRRKIFCKRIDEVINEREIELNSACIHDDIKTEDSYVSGTYYDRVEYIKKHICNICGKKIKEDITYGGYG